MNQTMNAQHTPGPWTHQRIGPRRGPVRLTDRTFIVVPHGGPAFAYLPEGRDDIQAANARLIAAAPDLLAAAERMLRDQDRPVFSMDFQGAVEALRAAIAKAGR